MSKINRRFCCMISLAVIMTALLVLAACSSATTTTSPGTTGTITTTMATTTAAATTTASATTTAAATTTTGTSTTAATTTRTATATTGAASTTSATTPANTTTSAATTTAAATAQPLMINLTAQGMAFDKSSIAVPAGAEITVNFDNMDPVPHNFALYTDSSAQSSIFVGQLVTNQSVTYTFTAPSTPGTYFFRCDVHPTTMTGEFIVQ